MNSNTTTIWNNLFQIYLLWIVCDSNVICARSVCSSLKTASIVWYMWRLLKKKKRKEKKERKKTQHKCREWGNTLWYIGHLYWKHNGHEPYDIMHGRFSPWGNRVAVLERVCNTRQPFMLAASLIAHRTSDTEEKNILSVFQKSRLSPL